MWFWLSLLFCTAPFSAFGQNAEVEVKSVHDAQTAFVVVYEKVDGRGRLKTQPGIYTPKGSESTNKTVPLITGRVLGAGQYFNGVLAQLSIGKSSDRNESFAVVDGRLVLFHTGSRMEKKDSFLVFGDKNGVPILDSATGSPVSLDLIKDPKHIIVETVGEPVRQDDGTYGELVLVTVKQPNMFGSGITLGLVVASDREKTGSEKSSSIRLLGNAWVIDYEFRERTDLHLYSILEDNNSLNVISPVQLRAVVRRGVSGDHPTLDEWRQEMTQLADHLVKDSEDIQDLRNSGRIPYFNLISGRLEMNDKLVAHISEDHWSVAQQIDPLSGTYGLFVEANSIDKPATDTPGFQGLIGRSSTDQPLFEYSVGPSLDSEPQEEVAAIAVLDKEITAFFKHRGTGDILSHPLFTPTEGVERLSSVYFDSGEGPHYFVVSIGFGKSEVSTEGVTWAFVFDEAGTGVNVIQAFRLTDTYQDDQLLSARSAVYTEGDGDKRLVFDLVTEAKTIGAYTKKAKSTYPRVDLKNTRAANRIVQVYLEELERVDLGRDLVFLRYDQTGAIKQPTGIYRSNHGPAGSDSEQAFFPGQLLYKGKKPKPLEEKTLESFAKRSALDPLNGTLVRVFAIGALPAENRKKAEEVEPATFRSLLVLDPPAIRKYPVTKEIEMPLPFDQLQGTLVLSGRRASSAEVSILFFFKGDESGQPGGVWAYNVRLIAPNIQASNETRLGIERIASDGTGWLTRDLISSSEIPHRIIFDSNGSLVWSETPEKQADDRSYAVRRLTQPGKKHYPNAAGSEVGNLLFDEPLTDQLDYEINFSRWQVLSTHGLETRIKGLAKILTDHRHLDGGQGNKAKHQELIYHLGAYLDEWLKRLQSVDGEPRQRILVVESDLKPILMQAMYVYMALNDKGSWSLVSDEARRFAFHLFDPGASEGDVLEEIKNMNAVTGGRRPILVGDFRAAIEAQAPLAAHEAGSAESNQNGQPEIPVGKARPEPDDIITTSSISRRAQGKPSVFFLLSSEGTAAHAKHFERVAGFRAKIAKLWVATPKDLIEARLTYPDEQFVIQQQYALETRFLTAPWSVWPPRSERAKPDIAKLTANPDELSIFRDLRDGLVLAATPGAPVRHRVFLVPDALKPFAKKIALGLWNSEVPDLETPWSHRNSGLSLLYLSSQTMPGIGEKQDTFLENLHHARLMARNGRRPVVLVELEHLKRLGSLHAEDSKRSYFLRDPSEVPPGDDGLALPAKANLGGADLRLPHALWLLATEGRRLTANQLREGLDKSLEREVSIVILGSPAEWKQVIHQDANFEKRFGLEQHFDVELVEAPSEDRRIQLLTKLTELPEIRNLNYRFKHLDRNPETAKAELLSMLVARVADIASQLKRDPVDAFVHAYGALRRHLIEDAELRSRMDDQGQRFIRRDDLERLLMKVFPIPINPAVLPPQDPLLKMKDPDRAALGLQSSGYDGPLEFKSLVARTYWSQTRPADEGRPIPASMILFGGTGTGKTHLAKTMIRFMGLKEYSLERPHEEEASAIIVKVQALSDSADNANPESIPVDAMVAHLYNLIAMPQGHRAFIWFDDLHKAQTPGILRKLLAFIQTLIEARDGLVSAKRIGSGEGVTMSVPIRNIFLGVTINPTKDEEKAERFVGKDKGNIFKQVLAGLDREGVQVEESLLARFGAVIDMSRFPREAKAPALTRRLRTHARQQYSMLNRLIVVDPGMLVRLVGAFPDSHAREFLTGAQSELLSIPTDLPNAPLYIVRAAGAHESERRNGVGEGAAWKKAITVSGNAVEDFVRSNRVVRPVNGSDLEGRLDLIHFLANGFRVGTLEALVLGAQASIKLSGTSERRQHYYAPFAFALLGDMNDHPEIPINELVHSGTDLGLPNVHPDTFAKALQQRVTEQKPFFTLPANALDRDSGVPLQSFLQFGRSSAVDRTVYSVIDERTESVTGVLRGAMERYFRVDSLDHLPDPKIWIERLDPQGRSPEMRDLRDGLVNEYITFCDRLTQLPRPKGVDEWSTYELGRLYMMVVNRALTRLPWAKIADFSIRILETATGDLRLGMRDGLLHFFFGDVAAPFHSMTPDFVLDLVASSESYQAIPGNVRDSLAARFKSQCEKLLEAGGAS